MYTCDRIVEMELVELWLAKKVEQVVQLPSSMEGDETQVLQQAVGVLRSAFS